MTGRAFTIGDYVSWRSHSGGCHGVIVAVVPPGDRPAAKTTGGKTRPRDHVSYLVRGRKLDADGTPYGPEGIYWPRVRCMALDQRAA